MALGASGKTRFVDCDILVVGGGFAGCGAAYEARFWGRNLKIVIAEKANIRRSGAVAHGLSAINCYMGMQWGENQPEDYVRYARGDLMGLVREDLLFDIGRHVDATVHKFEEWGLPIMRNPETGRYLREGRWQIMIHGESYKPIVAEAAQKSASEVYNRIMVTHLLMDKARPQRVAGAIGFGVRDGNLYVFRAKAVIVCGRRRVAHLPAAGDRRRHRTNLVCAVEQRFGLWSGDPGRRQNDPDGEQDRPHPLQGRLRTGRRLVPPAQVARHERVRRKSTRPAGSTRSNPWSASMPRSPRCRPACATTRCWRR